MIDSVNGVEAQTRRLMEVCRMRDTPVIVFINKMDRDGKNRFDLLEEIEKRAFPPTAPHDLADQQRQGLSRVYNLYDKNLVLFSANTKAAEEDMLKIDDLASHFAGRRNWEKKTPLPCGKMWNWWMECMAS